MEEQFYFLWPLVVYRLRAAPRVAKAALAGCLCVFVVRLCFVLFRNRFANIYLPYSFTASCADNLLYGCCLAALLRTHAREQVLRLAPPVFAAGSITLISMGAYYGGLPWYNNTVVPTIGFTAVALTCTALIALVLRPQSFAQRTFAHPVLRFFGRYSYGLYIFHYSMTILVGLPVRAWMNANLHSKALAVFASALCVLAVSIAIAVLSFHLYEAPFLRLKRRFPYRTRAAAG